MDDLEEKIFELVISQICLSIPIPKDADDDDDDDDDDDESGSETDEGDETIQNTARVCVKKSFVRILSGIAENYMTQLGRFTVRMTSRERPTAISLPDVHRAFSSISPHILPSIARSRGQLTIPFCRPDAARQLHYQAASSSSSSSSSCSSCSSSSSSLSSSPSSSPSLLTSLPKAESDLLERLPEKPFGSHPDSPAIPRWLPIFPGKHTYSRTPVVALAEIEPQAFREAQAKRRREVEVSLSNLCTRIRKAFPNEDLAASRLPKLPADPYAFDFDEAETKQVVQLVGDPIYAIARPTATARVRNPCLEGASQSSGSQPEEPMRPSKLLLTDLVQHFRYYNDPTEAVQKADRQTCAQPLSKSFTQQERTRRLQKTDSILNQNGRDRPD